MTLKPSPQIRSFFKFENDVLRLICGSMKGFKRKNAKIRPGKTWNSESIHFWSQNDLKSFLDDPNDANELILWWNSKFAISDIYYLCKEQVPNNISSQKWL